jgi:oxaloacetate decarboxylase alpha subunit
MRTEDMLPVLEQIDSIGYYSVEMWGGATFDACLRFLDENPWDRLRIIKRHIRKTPLQMLLRGQNVVGYRHYSDDIVRKFVLAAAKNGIGIFRIFDALNDMRNIKTSIEAVKEAGAHAQGAVVYTISPVHTLEHYVETAHELIEMGADSICIKDMAALLTPPRTEKLVKRLKKEIDKPINIHCHYIGGMAPMNYLKAIEAGADIIDTATVPIAFGNSQPATEMIVASLKETLYDSGIDLEKLYGIAEYFESVRVKRGFKRGVTSLTHMKVFSHQVPGGMISNLFSQLEEQKALDRLDEVLEEIPRVRAEVGYPPLVTPLSQIVGTQAVLNVLTGKRWGMVPGEMKSYIRGYYGRPPGKISKEIEEKILSSGETKIDCRPAELLTETFKQYEKEIGDLAKSEEDVLSYALFPNEAKAYLQAHAQGAEKAVFMIGKEIDAVKEGDDMDVDKLKELIKAFETSTLNEITIEEGNAKVRLRKGFAAGETAEADLGERSAQATSAAADSVNIASAVSEGNGSRNPNWKAVTSPMVGTFYKAPSPDALPYIEVGDTLEPGQTVCILEAMKLMNEITSEESGVVKEICVNNADTVQFGQVLIYYEPA